MDFDVVIVGAGPCGLSAACRLSQLADEAGTEINVCVVEKGSEIGAHIISGAVFESRPLDELFPDWQDRGAPVTIPVRRDEFFYLLSVILLAAKGDSLTTECLYFFNGIGGILSRRSYGNNICPGFC